MKNKKTFQIGNATFGEGRPKICVPIVAATRGEIWKKVEEISCLPVEIVEWRVDHYKDFEEKESCLQTLQGVKERLGEKALLFTFRTSAEGGNRSIEKEAYYQLNLEAAASGYAALIDIEAFLDEEQTVSVIEKLHKSGVYVITSNHDFTKTPDTEEMVRRLTRMEELGADVAKLAVMPVNRQDVLNLLQATERADEQIEIPVVTMSMGSLGVMSRLCGNLTGSAMTFASVGEASAPGQIPVEQMREFLNILS
jgi:3-dehydroquinate dehydratase-1